MDFLRRLWYKFQEYKYERKCIKHLGIKPQKTYISKEAYDELVRIINAPPDPKVVERLREIMQKPSPWND